MTFRLRKDLPISILLKMHQDESQFTELGALYEIASYLIRTIESKDKELSLDNLKFSTKSLKYIFGDKLNDEKFKSILVSYLKTLIELGHLENKNTFIHITELGITTLYEIHD
jgi:hypothetical protein